jgi:predicted metal-dependent hydrolase
MSDNIINEVRHEPLARQAQLWEAKEALEKAKFSDVISDGEEIFNAIADSAISQVESTKLIESTKND